MKVYRQIQKLSALMVFVVLLSFSCKRNAGPTEMPEAAMAYISGYSSGILSKAGPVKIRFSESPITAEEVGSKADASLLSLSPSASGSLYWEDNRTLRFDPDPYLKNAQAYRATLKLKSLFPNAPNEVKTISFNFDTREQDYGIQLGGLFPANEDDPKIQEFRGILNTADLALAPDVEEILTASQGTNALEIEWAHTSDQLEHNFVIKNIGRTETPGEVLLSWNGKSLGSTRSGNQTIEIPSLGDFRIVQATVAQSPEQAIVLQFSDPIRSNQDLTGLVRLKGYSGDLRMLIDGTQLFLYPEDDLAGSFEIEALAGIRSSLGGRMKSNSSWEISLNMPDPAVRLVGKGVIMPESDGLVFPFEAVGLNAVLVEIFKVYDNNILQFLQTNNLDGQDELRRVGELVHQKKVDLRLLNPTAEASAWGRYALDLSEFLKQDPDALYQVRIGFKPSYARFTCANNYTGQDETMQTITLDGEGRLQSMLDNWYGFEGYYNGYDWDDRDDPCKPAFYNYERFIRRNVLTSNLGIIAKGNDLNEFFVTVTDLRTTSPIGGTKVTFYDYLQQPVGSGETSADGTLSLQLDGKPFVAVASLGQEKGYLRLQDGNSLSLSRFDVGGTRAQKGLKGFLYADRGAWRPGDSVFLNFMLENEANPLPEAYPVVMELYNARNQKVESRNILRHLNHVYDLAFATAKDAPTGIWRVVVKAGGASFTKSLLIETIKPNRLDIELDLGGEKVQLSASKKVQASLRSRWLHGAPAAGLEAIVESQLRNKRTTFPSFSDFVFDDPSRERERQPKVIYKGKLDNSGEASFVADFSTNLLPSGKLNGNLRTRVVERGGDFSLTSQSIEISPFNAYVGLELPSNKYRQKRLDQNQAGQLNVALVNQEGTPLSNRQLQGEIYRVEWRWWWERSRNNRSTYNYTRNLETQLNTNLTTNNKGEAQWNLTIEDWGRYFVRVCDPVGGHCTGDFLYVGYPYGDDESRPDAAALLAVTAEKEQYAIGETINLTIPAEENSRALISLETGSEILNNYWVDLEPGDNQFSFEAEPSMAPNVYAHVSLVQAHAQAKNDRPIRLYGVLPIPVADPNTLLNPGISAPSEIRPESEFAIEVSEENGKAMTYTLAVVDEGLLGITGFRTPDPHSAFYAKEALGIRTWDVYDQVLGAYGGQLDRILSVGGDGEGEANPENQDVNRFDPVVMHLGPFELKRGQKATHKLQMPNYVGAVRTMVVASKEGAYGSADQTIPVRKPLMVLSTLPRVLGPGESIRIPVNVFAMQDKVKQVNISVKESSGLVNLVSSTQRISFSQPGNQVVYFDAQIKENTGVASFVVEATGNGEKASQEIEILVRNPNPYQSRVTVASLQGSESWEAQFEPIGTENTREGYLEVSTLPPLNMGERLSYLIQYPYGCVEQTVSAGFPQLYASSLLEISGAQEEKMKQNVQATIQRLIRFQHATGGFSYWPGSSDANQWGSTYAGHFLLEAQEKGYTVPTGLLKGWLDYQRKTARLWKPESRPAEYGYRDRKAEEELMQAYRLYTLALAKQADMASMNRLREQNNLAPQARWRLAAAYALAGKSEVAKQLTSNQSTNVASYSGISRTYGSALRDQAMILETLVLLEDQDRAAELAFQVAELLGGRSWHSTQTTSYCLLAIGKMVGASGVQRTLDFTYTIGSGNAQNKGSNSPVVQIPLSAAQLKGNTPIQLTNNGNGVVFARLVSRGQPVTGMEEATSSGLEMRVSFLSMNGTRLDPANLPQGIDLVAKVEVQHTRSRNYRFDDLALDQVFPSGWEILNSRISGISSFESSASDYQDIRDDRVYTFFSLSPGKFATYYVQLNAAYQGTFYLPGVHCEAMYDNGIQAQAKGMWVTVGQPEGL